MVEGTFDKIYTRCVHAFIRGGDSKKDLHWHHLLEFHVMKIHAKTNVFCVHFEFIKDHITTV